MTAATAESILAHVQDGPYKIEVDGEVMFLRNMSALVLRDLKKEADQRPKDIGEDGDWVFRVLLILRCTCDEEGARLFEDSQYREVAALSPAYMFSIIPEILGAYGLMPDEDDQDTEVGKSETTPNSDGGSD